MTMGRKKVKKTRTSSRTTTSQKQASRKSSSSDQGAGWLKRNLLPVLLLVITASVMLPVSFNDFITLDDEQFITGNYIVQNARVDRVFQRQFYSPHYKPLVYLSWIAETSVVGNNPYVLHTNNLLLHLISTLLAFFCMLRITQFWSATKSYDVTIAFFTALLFGIHPLHVESVAWAIERKDVLFGVFYFLGLLSYLKYIEKRAFKYLVFTAAFYLLSMLSKSMGITLIAMTFLIDWASGRQDWKKCLVEKWPLYIPVLLALFMYGFLYHPKKPVLAGGGESVEGAVNPPANIADLAGFYQRIVIAAFRYVFFFVHTIVPAKLALVYPRTALLAWPGQLIHLAVLGVAVIAALPFIFRKYKNVFLWGLLFFSIGIAPILVEEGPGTNFGSDRYTYIPCIGLFLMITTLCLHSFNKVVGKFSVGQYILGAFCAVLAVAAFGQARLWGSSEALYTQAILNYPANPIAYHYRGGAIEDSDPQAALVDYTRSIELNSRRYRPYFARGTLYLKLRRHQEAITDFTRTLELNNRYVKAWVNRGNAYRDLGQTDASIADYNEALKINRNFDKALNNRGAAYLKKGMYQEALEDFSRVIDKDPSYVNAYINRAALYINPNVKQYEFAIQDYDSALRLEPDNAQARHFRGVALRGLDRDAEALQDFNESITLSPNTGLYYYTRAQTLRAMGRREESVLDARKAQSLGYSVPAEYLQ
jgi:tetratricopeptide (TPR) repeat protein